MRGSRRLTTSERWELGLFLTMLIVGFLCLTAVLNLPQLPKLFAAVFHSPSNPKSTSTFDPPAASAANPSAIQFMPPTPTLELRQIGPELAMLPAPLTPTVAQQPIRQRALPIPSKPTVETKWYAGVKYRLVKTLRLRVTAYAPDTRCCWPYPGTTTASGMSVRTNHGHLVAADTNLIPMHALVAVPGYAGNAAVPVLDRGGAIKGHRLDVLMPSFDRAKDWGSQLVDVKVYMPVGE